MINLPPAFVETTWKLLGDEYPLFERALNEPPVLSVRVNDKTELSPSAERVAWCGEGYYLDKRPVFTLDPLFHAGAYYVQEASSMFLAQVAAQFFPKAERVLDLCAAPGGKSTLLAQNLPGSSLLVCNEIIRSRANILVENLIKWGNPNLVVSNNKPDDFARLPAYFDALVVDAPCSGEGMFRKDAQALSEWSEQSVNRCAERQRDILRSVWSALKTNGILVYSTCTYNTKENEDNVRWLCDELDAEGLKIDLKANQLITETDCGYRFYPHKTKGEGFFIAVVRKKREAPDYRMSKKQKKETRDTAYRETFAFSLLQRDDWTIERKGDKITACLSDRKEDFLLLNKALNVLHSGVSLGQIKGKSFVPDISVALSKALDLNSVDKVELDYKNAIAYLKRENLFLPEAKQGYLLLTYHGLPLGWAKNLGNRANNLYPHEWRIRMNC